jgi:hypothetical protein
MMPREVDFPFGDILALQLTPLEGTKNNLEIIYDPNGQSRS